MPVACRVNTDAHDGDAGSHAPVLLAETLAALAIQPDDCVLDCTFGRGGHSSAMLAELGEAGRLLGLDRDPAAVAHGAALSQQDPRFRMAHAWFGDLEAVLDAQRIGQVNAVLLDLGVSSPQLDEPERGFSFMREGPLDMRMDTESGDPASVWLQQVTLKDLGDTLKTLGEERYAKRIASAIVRAREAGPITTTLALADIVSRAVPRREPGKHPATRTFQAIRMAVNDELGQLHAALDAALSRMASGARIAVISFHSLEDRAVKRFFRKHSRDPELPRGLPRPTDWPEPLLEHVAKPCRAGEAELQRNPRARSATLRAATRRLS